MSSINKAIIIGNLGRDPELRNMPNGAAVCTVSLATTRSWKDKNSGDKVEETEWHRVVFFDRLADIAAEYLKKGSSVYVEGRLKTRKWQDKDGKDNYTTEIVAEQMQLLGGRQSAGGGAEDDGYGQQARGNGGGQQRQQQSRGNGGGQGYGGGQQSRPNNNAGRNSTASGRVPAAAGDFDEPDDIPFASKCDRHAIGVTGAERRLHRNHGRTPMSARE